VHNAKITKAFCNSVHKYKYWVHYFGDSNLGKATRKYAMLEVEPDLGDKQGPYWARFLSRVSEE
jgi:hypothetical protein